ncbi:UvrD-helicase domain-containing protein [Microbispora sp. H10830]|uniref:HelD family protein n=1 Tax=Microbispora sp. H10830 TaxID=2729109 RepID=UPI00160379DA|nr:UvrD-helicase domain-containing protein [Microbispora sp. H10830]
MSTVDRVAVIAEEQQAVSHIYACFEQDLKAVDDFRRGHKDDCPDAGLSPFSDVPREYGRREDTGPLALATMRVDLTKDPDDKLTWYIGRATVRDENRDLVLIKWTNPQAKKWRLATPDEPGDVRLQRQLRCEGRTVVDYSDTEIQVITSEGKTVPAPTGEEEPDPFLLADLDLARDGVMRDIVETIQRHQLRLVADERKGLLVIQGGPGTGKTAVGLHRVTWLLDNGHFTPDQVLVIGPHKGFLRYVRDVLPRLGSHGVATVEVAQLWPGEVRGNDPAEARLAKSDDRMARILHNAVEGLIREDLLSREEVSFSFRGATLRIDQEELTRLMGEARQAAGPYHVRRRRFIDTTVDWLMRQYAEATRTRSNDDRFRSQLERHASLAAVFNRVWPSTTPEQILRSLLADTEALRSAAFGVLTLREQEAILRPQAKKVAEEPWSAEDLVCLDELHWLLSGDEGQRFRHMVIDEAQDLTPMQARSLARRCPTGSMTVLGDLAQSTGIRQYDVWERLAGILSGADGWNMAELATGYRVPTEVMTFAARLGRAISPSTAIPVPVRPPSANALDVRSVTRQRIVSEAVNRALGLAMRDGDQARSVAVITPAEDDFLTEITREVAAAQDSTLPEIAQQVTVLPAQLAKGLEFDHVVVVEPQRLAQQGAVGLRRLYIALTRCTQTLTVLHSAPLPPELGGPATTALARAEKVEAIPQTAPEYRDRDQLVGALKERVAADRKQPTHRRIKHLLMGELFGNELEPQPDGEFADIVCKTERGLAIYVVSPRELRTYAELRNEAVRLLEIEWAGGSQADDLFLVLPKEPQDLWAVDLIEQAFKVSVIWKTSTGWDGPLVGVALGQPS